MTPGCAQGVKGPAGEVVAVEDAKRAVKLGRLLAAAPHEARRANAESLRG